MAAFESTGGWAIAAATKFGWLKLATLGGALIGASIMALTRPPKSRKEMFYQAATALGCSFLFGDFAVRWAASWFSFISFEKDSWVEILQFYVGVHGLLGAMSWGVFGALANLRDKVSADPIGTIKGL